MSHTKKIPNHQKLSDNQRTFTPRMHPTTHNCTQALKSVAEFLQSYILPDTVKSFSDARNAAAKHAKVDPLTASKALAFLVHHGYLKRDPDDDLTSSSKFYTATFTYAGHGKCDEDVGRFMSNNAARSSSDQSTISPIPTKRQRVVIKPRDPNEAIEQLATLSDEQDEIIDADELSPTSPATTIPISKDPPAQASASKEATVQGNASANKPADTPAEKQPKTVQKQPTPTQPADTPAPPAPQASSSTSIPAPTLSTSVPQPSDTTRPKHSFRPAEVNVVPETDEAVSMPTSHPPTASRTLAPGAMLSTPGQKLIPYYLSPEFDAMIAQLQEPARSYMKQWTTMQRATSNIPNPFQPTTGPYAPMQTASHAGTTSTSVARTQPSVQARRPSPSTASPAVTAPPQPTPAPAAASASAQPTPQVQRPPIDRSIIVKEIVNLCPNFSMEEIGMHPLSVEDLEAAAMELWKKLNKPGNPTPFVLEMMKRHVYARAARSPHNMADGNVLYVFVPRRPNQRESVEQRVASNSQ